MKFKYDVIKKASRKANATVQESFLSSREHQLQSAQSGCSATHMGPGSWAHAAVEAVEKCIPSTQLQPHHSPQSPSAHPPPLQTNPRPELG